MRCKNCGGEISLESAFCEYCGSPNESAQHHAREMKKFRRAFENSKSSVDSTVHRFTGLSVRLVIIAFLILVIFLLFIFGANAYSFRRSIVQNRSQRNAAQVMERMDALLEAEDFVRFSSFCDENCVDCYDNAFEKYAPVERAAGAFAYVYKDIMSIALPPEYREMEDMIEILTDDLEYFYSVSDLSEYEYYDGSDNAQNRRALAAMEQRIELLLVTYCDLSAEQAAELKNMSPARRAMLLEEAVMAHD